MQLPGTGCPFGDRPHLRSPRHDHDYTPGTHGAKRHSCGSRRWKITLGGPIPPQVSCASCGGLNWTATAYECGRAEGPRQEVASDDKPQF